MKQIGFRLGFYSFILFVTSHCFALPLKPAELEPKPTEINLSLEAPEASWIFSGIVSNESGELYNYYFQIQRKHNDFHALATLIDNQTKSLLLFDESTATIDNPDAKNWLVGKAFLKFNPINNSWVFGIKTKEGNGFNFKVDMLAQSINAPLSQDLRSGIRLLVNQTGRLNGHLHTSTIEKEQFVTAPKAWFKQIWVSKDQKSSHPITAVLCQFNDGSGFYSVNLEESDALRGAVTGWRDNEGAATAMSQFVSIKETKEAGVWRIQVPSPKTQFLINDVLSANKNTQLIAGLTEGEIPGFCTISKQELG